MTDLNAEFIRYRDCCSSAAQALQSGNFADASDLFNQALQMARLYSPRSADEALCLLGLGDSYVGLFKFGEAKSAYLQLVQLLNDWGETASERRYTINLQLAKCHEKLHEFDQACALYAGALELAEVTFPYGHPRMTSLLESYANVLRFARKDPQKLSEIEQKSMLSRSKQNKPQFLSAIVAKASESNERAQQAQEDRARFNAQTTSTVADDRNESESKLAGLQKMAGEHPRIAMGGALALLFFLVQIFALSSAIYEIKARTSAPLGSPAAVGNVYTSADGKETLRFLEKGKVEIKGSAGWTNARCYVAAPGWSEFIATTFLEKPNQLWLLPNSQGLRDLKSNKQLYNLKTCPILDLPTRLNEVAHACQLYVLKYNKYPDATTLLMTVPGITEKMSDNLEHPVVVVAGDKAVMAKDLHTFIDKRSTDLVHDKLAPSKIVCITMPSSQKMIITATDSNGNPIKSQLGSQLTIALSDGELMPSDGLSTKIAFFGHLPKSVVISSSAPDFLRHLYVNFLIVFCVATALAFGALKLKTIRVDPSSRGDGTLSLKIKVLAWLVWSIICIVTLYHLEETCSAYFFRG